MPTSRIGTTSSPPGTGRFYAKDDLMAFVELRDVAFRYGRRVVLNEVSLSIEAGAFCCLLGPSGCGKTTLLRLLGGYIQPESGTIVLDGQNVTGWPPEKRGIGMVFQNYALFPHLSAREN